MSTERSFLRRSLFAGAVPVVLAGFLSSGCLAAMFCVCDGFLGAEGEVYEWIDAPLGSQSLALVDTGALGARQVAPLPDAEITLEPWIPHNRPPEYEAALHVDKGVSDPHGHFRLGSTASPRRFRATISIRARGFKRVEQVFTHGDHVGLTHKVIVLMVRTEAAAMATEADWQWLDRTRTLAFDRLMPLAVLNDVNRIAAYRSHRDTHHDVKETYFEIRQVRGSGYGPPPLSATLVTPTGQSIQEQLLALHLTDRLASAESLLTRVQFDRLEVDEAHCPGIRQRIEDLSKTSFLVPRRSVSEVHPVMHEFSIDLGITEFDATVTDPGSSLVRWATGTIKTIQGCKGS